MVKQFFTSLITIHQKNTNTKNSIFAKMNWLSTLTVKDIAIKRCNTKVQSNTVTTTMCSLLSNKTKPSCSVNFQPFWVKAQLALFFR
jgi:hypothetical protein